MNYLPEPKDGWVVPVTISVSEDDKTFFQSKFRIILESLGSGPIPNIETLSVHGEWQGAGDDKYSDLNFKERFIRLSEKTKDGPVTLCIHGGGYFTGSSAMERTATLKLAQFSNGRAFAVDYRLAPQAVFPAPLIDVIIAYKYLIDPPAGALHDAIDPSRIVIAGDSAGVLLVSNGANRRVV